MFRQLIISSLPLVLASNNTATSMLILKENESKEKKNLSIQNIDEDFFERCMNESNGMDFYDSVNRGFISYRGWNHYSNLFPSHISDITTTDVRSVTTSPYTNIPLPLSGVMILIISLRRRIMKAYRLLVKCYNHEQQKTSENEQDENEQQDKLTKYKNIEETLDKFLKLIPEGEDGSQSGSAHF